jgi:hypothetical protein
LSDLTTRSARRLTSAASAMLHEHLDDDGGLRLELVVELGLAIESLDQRLR